MESTDTGLGSVRASVRSRLLFLLILQLCAFGFALIMLLAHQRWQGRLIAASRQEEAGQLFQRLVQLQGAPLRSFVLSCSDREDMVRCVETADRSWAAQNLTSILSSYNVGAVWVYDPAAVLIHHASVQGGTAAWEIPAVTAVGIDVFRGQHVAHFYTHGPGGLWEIFGATLHPATDRQRQTPPVGFVLAGSCLERGTINELSVLLGGTVTAVTAPGPDAAPPWLLRDELRLWRQLPAWDGRPLWFLEAHVPLAAFKQLRRSVIDQFLLGVAYSLSLLALVGWALRAWVTEPLRTVAASLKSGDSGSLADLQRRPDEFGRIGTIVCRFHEQRRELVNEVAQRQRAEADLLGNLEFERMMATISTRFVTQLPETLDAEFSEALERLGSFANVDRSYAFQFSPDHTTLSCAYEWCRAGVPAVRQRLQGITAASMPWSFALHQRGDVLLVERLDELPPEAATLSRELEAEGVRSVLCVPMICAGTVFGFVGFDAVRSVCHWTEKEVLQLRFAGEIFARALQHRRAEACRRQLEGDLAHARQIESLGRLAGGVAHDLNNLLVPVMGYADILRDELPRDHSLQPDVERIRRAAVQARGLTQQLLAFARRQVLDLQELDLGAEVEHFRDILRRLIPENIGIAVRIDPEVGPVQADPTQIRQIILNLALNARDAMPQGGEITITVTETRLDETAAAVHPGTPPGPYVMMSVNDTGMGMDAGTQKHLFEPFFTTKEPGKGTGLGLATVHGIVSQHGGRVAVVSAPGQGTTVSVCLPRVASDAGASVDGVIQPQSPAGPLLTVLVVEDADGVRDLVCRILPPHGFRVLSAASPEEAMQVARDPAHNIAILLTDVVMPGCNGRDLYQRLIGFRPFLRVLYMSGYPADVIARQGVLDPGIHFIAKPFTTEDLVAALRQALADG